MSRLISHDPFSRTEFHRTNWNPDAHETCFECRGLRYSPSGKPYLFKYYTESDDHGGYKHWHSGLFCSIQCHNSYHRTENKG